MKKIKILFLPLIIITLFSLNSCSSSDEPIDGLIGNTDISTSITDPANPSNPNNPSNPSNPAKPTTPITPTTPGGGTSSGDYWPTAINNQWVFKRDGVLQDPMKFVSMSTISGNAYYTFNQQSGTVSGAGADVSAIQRLRKSNGDYYVKMETLTSPGNGQMPGFTMTGYESLILKDYLAVGETWTDSYSQTTTYDNPAFPVITLDFEITGTILEKNSSITVSGHNYTNVIKIKYVQEATGMGQTSIITSYYWYAKNIGPVKIISEGDTQAIVQELDSYIVK